MSQVFPNQTGYTKNLHARGTFDGIAAGYDVLAEVFSFFQYRRWRRCLVSRLDVGSGDSVIDLCTGTAGVAMQVAGAYQSRVIGVDLSKGMLASAQTNLAKAGLQSKISLAMGRAETLPFADACADAVCVTFLLRYVEAPEATMREIVRVLKPGGQLTFLEFSVPDNPIARWLWRVYTMGVMPVAARVLSSGWRYVGGFLGPSITRFYDTFPMERLSQAWMNAGIRDLRVQRLSFGSAVVMWGTKSDS